MFHITLEYPQVCRCQEFLASLAFTLGNLIKFHEFVDTDVNWRYHYLFLTQIVKQVQCFSFFVLVMPKLANLANIISLPYLGPANQIQGMIIHENSLFSSILSKGTYKSNLVFRFSFMSFHLFSFRSHS